MTHQVLILDFGSQFTQLITRRLRELGFYSEVKPCTSSCDEVMQGLENSESFKAIILSGGPSSVVGDDAPAFDKKWFELDLPVLGICYGMQLMADHFGGELAQGKSREYGKAEIKVTSDNDAVFGNLKSEAKLSSRNHIVWMSHGDHVAKLPPHFSCLASSSGAPIAAFGNPERKLYAMQFHPEVEHTPSGREILVNFLTKVAGCEASWTPDSMLKQSRDLVKATVPKEGNIICALSGGVDSSVAATLVHEIAGERLHCIFVDNGFLRKGEAEQVMEMLGSSGIGLNIKCVDAKEKFLSAVAGVTDPEKKRKIIGRCFIEVFEEESAGIENVTHLVQGTLYPDVIESISHRGPSATIKTHHNVGGLPERMNLKLIEPLRELFKDEVRVIGKGLGLSDKLLLRQPFPGPGLAIRILGEINDSQIKILQDADKIVTDAIEEAGLTHKLWQSFAVLLPVKNVGVMGDARTYEQVIGIRAVHSVDGMTADWSYLPEELLRTVSNKIINSVKGVNRVVLDISSKPPATIEWE